MGFERKALAARLLAFLAFGSAALGQSASHFHGKTVTVMVGYAAGGGTDTFARLAAGFLANYLPGSPAVIVRNVPGADGITAMNYFVEQIAPDGLTIAVNASTTADPMNWRKPQAHYDPTKFGVIGGAGRGGVLLVIAKEAEKRLYDKQARPVIMGSLSGLPRSGMQMTAWGIEFLGWNAKWVIGYRGTTELMIALERGEIDMTSTGNLFQVEKLLATGRFKVLAQTGMLREWCAHSASGILRRAGLRKNAGRQNPRSADAQGVRAIGAAILRSTNGFRCHRTRRRPCWTSIAPPTRKIIENADFIDRGRKMSDDFEPWQSGEVELLINTLGQTPPEAIDQISVMLRKQGLQGQ